MLVDGRHRAALRDEQVDHDVDTVDGFLALGAQSNDAIHRQTAVFAWAAQLNARPVAADGGVVVVPARYPLFYLLLQPRTLLQILEAFQHLRRAALVRPRRNDARQVVVPARVGVDVGAHIDASLASGLDERHQLVHLAPQFLVG